MVDLNRSAQILTKDLKAKGIDISKVELLDTVARMHGQKNWIEAKVKEGSFDFTVSASYQALV